MASDVIAEIAAERVRQTSEEGWTTDHDDMHHADRSLPRAAATYAWLAALHDPERAKALDFPYEDANVISHNVARRLWPLGWGFPKPKDRRRDLIRAAALIVAEIERLDRASARVALSKQEERS